MAFLSLKCLGVKVVGGTSVSQAVSQPAYVRPSFILSITKKKRRK